MKNLILILSSLLLLASCDSIDSTYNTFPEGEKDHTNSNFDKARTKHLDWNAEINFDEKKINATAKWTFENKGTDELILDIKDITITKVLVSGKEVKHKVKTVDDMGDALVIPISDKDSTAEITYTAGSGTAIQWLAKEQTAGKKMPYLFTQCESIYARTLVPCQDAPANRITYSATVKVPVGMMAVMSAKNPTEKNAEGIYTFEMELPIVTYMIALAAGDIEYKAIDERSGVYTEPSMLAKCAKELEDIPSMITAAERLGGPYPWGNYDVLVCPPSFPIGGMENPRLTFATPTIIAGDKSLVSLIAHELAHSWSGNLVTNSNWNDLWLNEGFTSYFEKRIMEEITDKDYTEMLWEIAYQDLQADLKDFKKDKWDDTRLKVDLKNRHPEESFSAIPYDKGALFLRTLEEAVGRQEFDAWLTKYFAAHKFTPMNTGMAVKHMEANLDLEKAGIDINEWIFNPGLPEKTAYVFPERFKKIDEATKVFLKNPRGAEALNARSWSTHEWLYFLRKLPKPLDTKFLRSLDASYALTGIGNSEIADEWYLQAIASNYEKAYPAMEKFLKSVGRKKFLEPLYKELVKTEDGKKMAIRILDEAAPNYHPLAARKMGTIVK
jgi:aminopeptidase N